MLIGELPPARRLVHRAINGHDGVTWLSFEQIAADFVQRYPRGGQAKPESVTIEDVYGTYKAEVELVDAKHIRYKRSLLMKSGVFPASDYEKFRKFNEQVSRADNAKCVLVKL